MSHDCCSPKNSKKNTAKKADSFIMWLIGGTIVLTSLVVVLGMKIGQGAEVKADTSVTLSADEKTHDWGTIDYDAGIVSRTFEINNTSESTLKLYDVKTSCMCTTAQLKTAEATSRKFGMHEKSGSVFEVKPGEAVELLVEFDPAFHGPSGVGPITRTITMNTNDASNPSLSFNLTANVVKK